MEYWLSWLPPFSSWSSSTSSGLGTNQKANPTLRDRIEALCCTPITDSFDFKDAHAASFVAGPQHAAAPGAPAAPREARVSGGGPATASIHPFTQLLMDSLQGAGPEPNAATLLLGSLGATTPKGAPLISPTALQNPTEALLVHGVLGPVLAPLLSGTTAAPQPSPQRVDDLTAQVKSLQETVASLRAAVDRLSSGRQG